jgi:hypothetical protein
MAKAWKKERGRLGALAPLPGGRGRFADGAAPLTRAFEAVLGGSYVRLEAHRAGGGSDPGRSAPRGG